MNAAFSQEIIQELQRAGVREFCVCPGARNSPLVARLSKLADEGAALRLLYFFEERSAAFFALGRIKATDLPVAVVTTSGTAVAELLPATMEAHYSSLPLVLLTADRPRRFRNTGAPQTAEQVGIFGPYVQFCFDLAAGEPVQLSSWQKNLETGEESPLHVNVCFEEPLLDGTPLPAPLPPRHRSLKDIRSETNPLSDSTFQAASQALREFFEKTRNPLIVVGGLHATEREPVADFLAHTGAPVFAEAPSGLRETPKLEALRVRLGEGLLGRAERNDFPIDGVLRIGSVPTHRLWRDLEAMAGRVPVLSMSSQPFSGLSWGALRHVPLNPFFRKLQESPRKEPLRAARFLERDRELERGLSALLEREPASEPGLLRALSQNLPGGTRVFLGNSLPIREWDLAASREERKLAIGACRGLNGIDGQLSSFLGFSEQGAENVGIFGDLTTLYDLPAPWILPQLGALRATICVINNGGGKIFERMFPAHPQFQNPHGLSFEPWARMWQLPYELREGPLSAALPFREKSTTLARVLEFRPDARATARFWREYETLLAKD